MRALRERHRGHEERVKSRERVRIVICDRILELQAFGILRVESRRVGESVAFE